MAGLKDKRGFIDKDRLDLSERKAVESRLSELRPDLLKAATEAAAGNSGTLT